MRSEIQPKFYQECNSSAIGTGGGKTMHFRISSMKTRFEVDKVSTCWVVKRHCTQISSMMAHHQAVVQMSRYFNLIFY